MSLGRVALVLAGALALACAEPTPAPPDVAARTADCDSAEATRQQLALLLEILETERALHGIALELTQIKDETFFAALERKQAELRIEHGQLVTKFDALVRSSSKDGEPPLPEGCDSIAACFALRP